MEIVITFLNNLTQMHIVYAASAAGLLTLILIYRMVILPKMRIRKVLECVRQRQYEMESKKVTRSNSFTWGENIDRTNIGTAYEVEEFADATSTRIKEVMANVGG